ncbi:MAG: DUF21 domain-containing protein [Kiritimatiellaeota bacterium]|nr:DUF21 domain-containing protein [Kiritimatiellota bacterium]
MGYWIATFFFIAAQAFFSGAETGLISLRKSRVRHGVKSGARGAKILDFFITHPRHMLATTLVGTNISVVCASKMAKEGAAAMGLTDTASMFCLTLFMTLFLMSAEIIPKDWFRQSPYHRCLKFSVLLEISYRVLYLPVRLMSGFTKMTTTLLKGSDDSGKAEAAMMREDFSMLLRESVSAGVIDSEAADILDRSLEFHGTLARDLFVPKDEVVDAPANMTVKEAVRLCGEKGVSRLPVRPPDGNAAGDREIWIGGFSLYDIFFSLPENQWETTEIGTHSRSMRSVPLNANMELILLTAKEADSSLLAVNAGDGGVERHVGIVSGSDVAKCLFG